MPVVVAVLLSGCSVVVVRGSPSPSYSLPPRPRDVMVDAVDPCAVLTTEHRARLQVAQSDHGASDGRRLCYWLHSPDEPRESYIVEIITKYGAEDLLQNPLGAEIIRISGFPAVETQTLYASRELSCQIFLDVAARQTVQVSYSYNGSLPMTRKQACEKDRLAAELVMHTLLARTGG
ncbi:DUF3558 family protein [Actinomycetes bacterium KLBMP 9759]